MRREAIELAAAGFRVIPLKGKKPFWDEWQNRALCDPFDVVELWPGGDYNVGIVCGHGLAVLDVDVSKGGAESLARMEAELGSLPVTRRVRTQSGGWHYYFATPDGDISNAAKNLQDRFGPGLDVRGRGGQVVAPGSVYEGRPYSLECDAPIAHVPLDLLALLQSAPVKAANAGEVVGELDTPGAIERARDWVERSPDVFEGGRDDAAFKIAARLYDFGVSHPTCLEILSDWSEKKCNPSLSEDDLERIASSAAKNRQDAIGSKSVEALAAVFGTVEHPPGVDNPFDAWSFDQTEGDEEAMPPRPWLAGRRLIRGKLSSLVAPGSVGKSLLTLQWACALAMGRGDWCGLDVRERSRVLVLNNEDEKSEMGARLAAVIRHFRLPREELWHRIKLISGAANPHIFLKRAARGGSLDETAAIKTLVGYCVQEKIDVVVFDPVVDTHEANENDNGEMARVMRVFRRIASEANVSVLLVHHTKKPPQGASDGYAGSADAGRGASAIVNAVRVGMTLFNMGERDAMKFGIPPARRHLFVRLDDAKANLFLASPVAQWFERKSIRLPNGEESGALQPVELTDKTVEDGAAVVAELASLLETGSLSLYAAATVLDTQSKMYGGDGVSTLRKRIKAALVSGDTTCQGVRFRFAPSGKLGGTITVSRDC